MKTSTVGFALVYLASFSYAAPSSPCLNARQVSSDDTITVTFFGAGSSFEQKFPIDNSTEPITNRLSVSRIFVESAGDCYFTGLEGSVTHVSGETSGDVGPPQPQVSGSCLFCV